MLKPQRRQKERQRLHMRRPRHRKRRHLPKWIKTNNRPWKSPRHLRRQRRMLKRRQQRLQRKIRKRKLKRPRRLKLLEEAREALPPSHNRPMTPTNSPRTLTTRSSPNAAFGKDPLCRAARPSSRNILRTRRTQRRSRRPTPARGKRATPSLRNDDNHKTRGAR